VIRTIVSLPTTWNEGLGGGEADNGDGVIYASELYGYLQEKVSLEEPNQHVYGHFGDGNPIVFKTIDY